VCMCVCECIYVCMYDVLEEEMELRELTQVCMHIHTYVVCMQCIRAKLCVDSFHYMRVTYYVHHMRIFVVFMCNFMVLCAI
jgi:hypothetical protein